MCVCVSADSDWLLIGHITHAHTHTQRRTPAFICDRHTHTLRQAHGHSVGSTHRTARFGRFIYICMVYKHPHTPCPLPQSAPTLARIPPQAVAYTVVMCVGVCVGKVGVCLVRGRANRTDKSIPFLLSAFSAAAAPCCCCCLSCKNCCLLHNFWGLALTVCVCVLAKRFCHSNDLATADDARVAALLSFSSFSSSLSFSCSFAT